MSISSFKASMLWPLHRLVSIPVIYDFSQKLAGGNISQQILRQELSCLPETGSALDVGGGTGRLRPFLPPRWRYTCLDTDPKKLKGFKKNYEKDQSIKASGCHMPVPDQSYDICLMKSVTHHLNTEDLAASLKEIKRVLRPGGLLILVDAIWCPSNVRGRTLWCLDRGNFPRTKEALTNHLTNNFLIERKRFWRVNHNYALFWCRKI
jgi:ubiquinone/menaquinone biosynthesis C-methylase UbiE